MTLGKKIKEGRKRIGLTQEQLAETICVSRQAIQKWESDGGIPSIENLKAISQLFGVSIDSLVSDEDPHKTNQALEPVRSKSEPQCGKEISQIVKTCPNCGAAFVQNVNFCNRCGYSFEAVSTEPSVQSEAAQSEPAIKSGGAGKWMRSNLKWLLPLAIGLVVVIVLCSLIPTFKSLGKEKKKPILETYYFYEEGKYNTSFYIELNEETWRMKESSGSYINGQCDQSGKEIILYYKDEPLFSATVNADLLTLKNILFDTEILFCKEGHVHNFGEWKTTDIPTCVLIGFEERSCYCGLTEINELSATGVHLLDKYTPAKESTCTKEGNVAYYTCSVCKRNYSDDAGKRELYTVTVSAKGHTRGEWQEVRSATCGESGLRTISCTVCGVVLESGVIEVTGAHVFEKGACTVCEATQVNYELSSDGTYYIVTGLNDAAMDCEEIEILSSYQDLPVKEIKSYAFYNCEQLTGVKIPDSVTAIGMFAFAECRGITSIKIPRGMKTIEKNTFQSCSALESVQFSDSVTSIGEGAFMACVKLTSIEIPHGVKIIEKYTFQNCIALESVRIPDSVTAICESAFNNCVALSGEIMGSNIVSVGTSAFKGCSGLTSVEIPASVAEIGEYAFYECSNLAHITVPDFPISVAQTAFMNTAYYSDQNNWIDEVLYIGNYLVKAKSTISGEYRVREGTVLILSRAFQWCNSLTGIVIPDSVKVIDGGAFQNCDRLESVTLGKGVTEIGEYAFSECRNLTSVVIPDGVTSIAACLFYGCSKLESVTMGSGVTEIETMAFYSCNENLEITYKGKIDEWNAIVKSVHAGTDGYVIHCSDGDIAKSTGAD